LAFVLVLSDKVLGDKSVVSGRWAGSTSRVWPLTTDHWPQLSLERLATVIVYAQAGLLAWGDRPIDVGRPSRENVSQPEGRWRSSTAASP